MKRALLVLLLTSALAAPAWAQAETNIGLTQYPAPACEKPAQNDAMAKPTAPPENPSNIQADAYNKRVLRYNNAIHDYNREMEAYVQCLQAYIARGNADMRRIRDAIDAAVAAGNAK